MSNKSDPNHPMSCLRFMHAQTLASSPPNQDWLVKGILPANTLIGVIGATGSFKSAIITDMAVSIGAGMAWHGLPVKRGLAMILAGEGHGGYKRRLRAIADMRGIDLNRTRLWVSQSGADLLNTRDLTLLKEKFESCREKYGKYPSLIIIDTVARNFGAGDENSASDMGRFIEHMDSLRRTYECTVVLVHHTGHANQARARGSSSFKAALDFEITVKRKDDCATLTCSKNKDDLSFNAITFKSRPVKLRWKTDNGVVEFDSFVMDRVTATESAPKYKTALQVLKDLEAGNALYRKSGVPVSTWRQGVIDKKICVSRKSFEKVKQRLLDLKEIKQPAKGFVLSMKRG